MSANDMILYVNITMELGYVTNSMTFDISHQTGCKYTVPFIELKILNTSGDIDVLNTESMSGKNTLHTKCTWSIYVKCDRPERQYLNRDLSTYV